nr:probable disease resistance protein At5g66900 [Ziziphus jujuba var. spinosa]
MVLDDVWPEAESLIKKFVFKIRDYKILITSRYELPKFAPPYHLSPLNDEDAMTLFRHSACWEDGEPGIPDYIVKKMVDSYKRIPLAIKIVAGSLGRQPVEIWQKRLEECSDDSSSRPDSENELLASLISDLDYSKVLVKECFKDLASFPEDRMIPVAALIDMWTELYELEAHVLDIILDLTAKNLANLKITRKDVKEVDDYYGQHFLVQHDLLREIAMDNSSQEPIRQRKRLFINLSRNELPESLKEYEMISSNWLDMQLPEAEVLVLNFRTKDYALPTFVVNMKKLKVLIATSSLNYAELSDFQLLGLLTNLKTIRLERISIPSLSETCEPLRNLQKISLYMCRFAEAFRDCSIQISDLLPELREMNVDFCEDLVRLPAGLCDIVHLKKLSITHCYKLCELPNEIGNLRNLQVLRLRSCTELEILPDSIRYLSELFTLDISDCIRIKDLPEDIGELKKLINLNMNHCSRLQYLPESFWQLEQSLDLVCDKEIKEVWENFYPDDQRNITMRSVKEDINLEWLPAFS